MHHPAVWRPASRITSSPVTPARRLRRGVIAALVAVLTAAGCAPRYSIPAGMVIGGAGLGWVGSELSDDDPTLGFALGAIPGLLIGTGVGLLVGISHELQKAYREK